MVPGTPGREIPLLLCVFTHAAQLFIQTLLLKSCEYLLYALGCWFTQVFGKGSTHFPVALQDSLVNSVHSPDIYFSLVLILDFRVKKCLGLGWGVFLQVLGMWPEGSTKTKMYGISTTCISGRCESCGWGEWLVGCQKIVLRILYFPLQAWRQTCFYFICRAVDPWAAVDILILCCCDAFWHCCLWSRPGQ